MKLNLLPGLIAAAALVSFVAATGDYWRAPRVTVEALVARSPTDPVKAWREQAINMFPVGMPDRRVERRLLDAGFEVVRASNVAQLLYSADGGFIWLAVTWRLDSEGRLKALETDGKAAAN